MTEPVLVTQPVGNDKSRVIKMVGLGGFVVLALLVLPKVLGGGGGSADVDPFPPPSSVPTTAPAERGGADVETLGSYGNKNPFTPLMDIEAGASPSSPASAVVTPGPEFSLDPIIVDGSGDFSDPGAPGETTTPTTAPPRPTHRLFLLEVYTGHDGRLAARVRVDDLVMETAVGEDFGGSYRTISLNRDTGCGVFLFGDRRVNLCEGHEAIT